MATRFLHPTSLTFPIPSTLQNPNPNSAGLPHPRTSTLTHSSIAHPSLAAKQNLLTLISDEQRGLKTLKNPSNRSKIIESIEEIAALGSDTITTGPSLSGTWRLLWTTEKEQLFIIENASWFGTRAGDVLQVIDVENRVLSNVITFPPHGAFFVRAVVEIGSPQRVNFRCAFVGFLDCVHCFMLVFLSCLIIYWVLSGLRVRFCEGRIGSFRCRHLAGGG